jgi:hypothetical protein
MGKELTTRQTSLQAIETALANCSVMRLRDMTLLERTLTLAESMAAMRTHFRGDILDRVKGLANTPLGFLTDRSDPTKATYPDDTVRDCVIEAMLRGAQPIGNEFNIIASRCYLTKQYFERAVRQFPGLTELRVTEGVPQTAQNQGGALVACSASWKLGGVRDEIKCADGDIDTRIAVRVNAGMGVDAILGKAKRKLLARVFARITGSDWVDPDAEPAEELADVVESAQAAASESETPAETKPEPNIFTNIEAVLGAMEQLTEVGEYQAAAAALLTTEEDKLLLAEWCDVRREAIREGRGSRKD